jgi:hypothetical protein
VSYRVLLLALIAEWRPQHRRPDCSIPTPPPAGVGIEQLRRPSELETIHALGRGDS